MNRLVVRHEEEVRLEHANFLGDSGPALPAAGGCGSGDRPHAARSGRPLRSNAEPLTDADLLDKLRSFGIDLDREGLSKLCEGALSAEEVACELLDSHGLGDDVEADWIWISLVTLWQRWWPDRVCLEFLDDKVHEGDEGEGRGERGEGEGDEGDEAAQAPIWLDAWSDVLRLCDATGISSIAEFDARFPMTQSLYNWNQDLQNTLWNAGLRDHELLLARIGVCEEALRRFPGEDQLMTENCRRALAESYFEAGLTGKAEELYTAWLAADPGWGWGWIGWADCYSAGWRESRDYGRAEELLRRGYAVPEVRDQADIASRLRDLCQETGRPGEAHEFADLARQLRGKTPAVSMSRRPELADGHHGPAALRQTTRLDFGPEGLPLNQFDDVMQALRAQPSRFHRDPVRRLVRPKSAGMHRAPAEARRSSKSAAAPAPGELTAGRYPSASMMLTCGNTI